MATPSATPSPVLSKEFPLDASIFTEAKLTLSSSTDANAQQAIQANQKFPDGNIEVGHIAVTADTGNVSIKPELVGGSSVSFELAASMKNGVGVYGKSGDAIKALNLQDAPSLNIPDQAGQRYLLMDWGYSVSGSGSLSHPIGLLGTISFGVDVKRDSVFAVLHQFDANQGAHDVMANAFASWRLPSQVAYDGRDVNLKPGTWLLAEADGSLALTMAATLGWNVNFAKDAKLLGVTQNLSAKIDASLKTNLGFNVSGRYILVVGLESAAAVVRLRLFKQSNKGLDFGLNLSVGVQGPSLQLPVNFDDFIKTTFGVHGLQVLNDLREWTDPSTDLGQKLAGLTNQTALDLLKSTTGIDPAAEFDRAKQTFAKALNIWNSLPDKVSSMLWSFLGRQSGQPAAVADFTAFLNDFANPLAAADALAKTLQTATFGDTPQGQFLGAFADQGLLGLVNNLGPVSSAASNVVDILNGGIIAKLQSFINQKLDLNQVRNAVTNADFAHVDQWLQNRLSNFLDRSVGTNELKDIQKAIRTLDLKVGDYYKIALQALGKRYTVEFAATYQAATAETALIDVDFDLSNSDAASMFTKVVAQSNLDNLLTQQTNGVTLNEATLTHEIKRRATVDVNMPLFDFSSTHVNDAMASLTAEDQGGRLLLYQVDSQDKVTVENRAASQLSVLASLKFSPGQPPQIDAAGSISYEMRNVKANMRPIDLEGCTATFIRQYLDGLFSGGDASIRSFYTDLDNALTAANHNQSNFLGDMAVSMQLSIRAAILAGWLEPRSGTQLSADQMRLSRSLQAVWKSLLPALYFQDLGRFQFNVPTAALLVWSSLPVSTSIDFNNPTIKRFNTDKDVFWDWPDVDLRRAVACDSHTISILSGRLAGIENQLLEAGSGNASFFAASMAGQFVQLALNSNGDVLLGSLLFTEAQLVRGAADALKQISATQAKGATAPTQAIKALAKFAAALTDTFNHRVSSVYAGMSGRVVGPMLLVEASAAVGSPGVKPAALMNLYALRPGHTFDLGTFVDGQMPPQDQVTLTQTLVSLNGS